MISVHQAKAPARPALFNLPLLKDARSGEYFYRPCRQTTARPTRVYDHGRSDSEDGLEAARPLLPPLPPHPPHH
mgnify:CR=1 FL=1